MSEYVNVSKIEHPLENHENYCNSCNCDFHPSTEFFKIEFNMEGSSRTLVHLCQHCLLDLHDATALDLVTSPLMPRINGNVYAIDRIDDVQKHDHTFLFAFVARDLPEAMWKAQNFADRNHFVLGFNLIVRAANIDEFREIHNENMK